MSQPFNSSVVNVVICYLQQLNVSFTKTNLVKQLKQNPYYPSLYSISSVLEEYNIPNEAYRIDKENFDELQPPFITFCENLPTGKDFVLITATTPTDITYLIDSKKSITVS